MDSIWLLRGFCDELELTDIERERVLGAVRQIIHHSGDFHYVGLSKDLIIARNQILVHQAVFIYKALLHVAGVPGQLSPYPQTHIYAAGCDGMHKTSELLSQIGDTSALEGQAGKLAVFLRDNKKALINAVQAVKQQKVSTDPLPLIISKLLKAASLVHIAINPGNHECYAKNASVAKKSRLDSFYEAVQAANQVLMNGKLWPDLQAQYQQAAVRDGGRPAADTFNYIEALLSGDVYRPPVMLADEAPQPKAAIFCVDSSWLENFTLVDVIQKCANYIQECFAQRVQPVFNMHHLPSGVSAAIGKRLFHKFVETAVTKGCPKPTRIGDGFGYFKFQNKYQEPASEVPMPASAAAQQSMARDSYAGMLPHYFQYMLQQALDKLQQRMEKDRYKQLVQWLEQTSICRLAAHQHATDAVLGGVYVMCDNRLVWIPSSDLTANSADLLTKHLHQGKFKSYQPEEGGPEDPRQLKFLISMATGEVQLYHDGVQVSPVEASIENWKEEKSRRDTTTVQQEQQQTLLLLIRLAQFYDAGFKMPRTAEELRRFILSIGSPKPGKVAFDALLLGQASVNKPLWATVRLRHAVSADDELQVCGQLLQVLTVQSTLSWRNRGALHRAKRDLFRPRFIGHPKKGAAAFHAIPIEPIVQLLIFIYFVHRMAGWTCDVHLDEAMCKVASFPNATSSTTAFPVTGPASHDVGIVNWTNYGNQIEAPFLIGIFGIGLPMLLAGMLGLSQYTFFPHQLKKRTKGLGLIAYALDTILIKLPMPMINTLFAALLMVRSFGLLSADALHITNAVTASLVALMHIAKFAVLNPDMRFASLSDNLAQFLDHHYAGKRLGYKQWMAYPVYAIQHWPQRALYNTALVADIVEYFMGANMLPDYMLRIILTGCVLLSVGINALSMVPTDWAQRVAEFVGRSATNFLEIVVLFDKMPSMMSQWIDPKFEQGAIWEDPNYFAGGAICAVLAIMLVAQRAHACKHKRPVFSHSAARMNQQRNQEMTVVAATEGPQYENDSVTSQIKGLGDYHELPGGAGEPIQVAVV